MNRKTIIFFMMFSLLCFLLVSCNNVSPAETTSPEVEIDETEATVEITEEATTEEATTAAPETTEEETKMTLRIGSYNIKHAADAKLNLSTIAKVITEANLDIVGLQEVDLRTTRVNGIDQPRMLADAAGMPYYVFVRAIDFKGGQYGTLILSKYPIVSSEVIPLESWDKEARSLGHAVIDVNGIQIDFFNTHLSYEDKTLRQAQFFEVSEKTDLCKNFILTGDFNTADFSEFTILGANLINNVGRWYPTFPGGNSAIDNIVYTDSFKEIASGTVTKSFSDHYMLWAEFEIN
jgi:endonuclease/exonuclease/phosphatase family metal-dependent hydrolase